MALGTERDTATNAQYDIDVQQQPKARLRSRPTRSPSLNRSSTNGTRKRSPSITFHPAPLSAENTKGVKNITRKVIKRLEGLGHLEVVNLKLAVSEEEDEPEELGRHRAVEGGEDNEVEKLLYALAPNLEIPRKVLHSSIGLLSSSILIV